MKYRLGQKVRYKRISKKIEIDMQYWTPDDFEGYEEKVLERREFIEFYKERTGYVMGRRNLVFRTYFVVARDSGDDWEPASEWVEISRQEYGFAYLVACDMGHTNYVLEEDLKRG